MRALLLAWLASMSLFIASPLLAAEKKPLPPPGPKDVTSVGTGAGLTGGPITTTGTIAVATGGITAGMIADGSVGLADVNQFEIQKRVTTSCDPGLAMKSITYAGVAVCDPVGRLLTSFATGGSRSPAVTLMKSIGVPPVDYPIIAYVDTTTSKLAVARCGNSGCSTSSAAGTPDTSATGVANVNAVANATGAIVAYRATVGGVSQVRISACGNALCSTSTSSLVENNAQVGTSIGLALGADGLPILSYYSDLNQLRIAKCANATCTSSTKLTLDTTTGAGIDSDIAFNGSGLPVIAYSTGTDVKTVTCGNQSCSSGNLVTTLVAGVGGNDVQIAFAPGGQGFVLFQKSTSPQRTQLADLGGTVYTIEDGSASGYALDVASDGVPVMSYRYVADNTTSIIANDLRVARCRGTYCNTGFTVTSARAGNVYGGTSLAIGVEGDPIIAFDNDAATDNVGINKCASPSCF